MIQQEAPMELIKLSMLQTGSSYWGLTNDIDFKGGAVFVIPKNNILCKTLQVL